MKAKLLVVSLSLIIAAACSKDKFGTKPVLTFEGVNATTFGESQNIQLKLRLTDKEGDFYNADAGSDSGGYTKPYLFYQRFSYKCQDSDDSTVTNYKIPAFPTNKFLDVELDIQYTYGVTGQYPTLPGCRPPFSGDDSTYFKIWILDDAGHVSDTVTTPAIKLIEIK